MKEYFYKAQRLVLSATAKDTYTLFVGNVLAAFLGFLFTLIVARSLSIADFGVFSAVVNLVIILFSLSDIGISSGVVNFVSENIAKGKEGKVDEYIKASFVTRLILALAIFVIVLIFAPLISSKLLATGNSQMAVWAGVISLFWFLDMLFPFVLQAKKKFLQSVIFDSSFYIGRLGFALVFFLMGALTIQNSFWAFGVGFLANVALFFILVGVKFLKSNPGKEIYKNLLKFSGWVGVNRLVSSISGRLDVQMMAAMAGAVATGLYSIPSKLASFIIVLAGSFSSVLATRLASFGDKEKERSYIKKSTLALLPITAGIVLWILVARPFITILFGEKYLPAVPVFQALAASQIPFLFTVPAVSAIIYAMKRTVYIGTLSFFQLIVIFLLNYIFIPKFGPLGPTLTFGITNTLLAVYVWTLVIRHYWIRK